MRGATELLFSLPKITVNFYSRTPCEVRLYQKLKQMQKETISTHAPHARCDGGAFKTAINAALFLLTHPMRGATVSEFLSSLNLFISTHAPHARCDFGFIESQNPI